MTDQPRSCESKKASPGDLGEGGQVERADFEVALRDLIEALPPIADVHGVPGSKCHFCASKWENFYAAYEKARALLKDGER